ncbi:SusD/RagB family nutrient-binding outer membrane lipoprotein [Proteiniphilum sp. X52]|uniref:SusD/RagB family nutrient-binding outer membrane lipoprotein n=1 Tax=Proteiniphilum sp. X52 TaxID=2382159 RepID=UPI001313F456|nr:SusD/RagB family nutrient-binding outer membrane lipoprotein [Proteiniphilum sp. X52]
MILHNNKLWKNAKTITTVLVGIFMLSACTKGFDEINRPGEKIDREMLERDGYLTGSFFKQLTAYSYPAQENLFQHFESLVGGIYAHYGMFTATGWYAGHNPATYNMPESWISEPFSASMREFYKEWKNVADLTQLQGIDGAWAIILRAQMVQRLTDAYGPQPYSQISALNHENTAYDSQEQVYKEIINDLTQASDMLAGIGAVSSMADYDDVYAGDFSKWRKFANSLKLRMAIRMSAADPAFAQKAAEEAIQAGVIEKNEDNAAIQYPKNPLYVVSYPYKDYCASADIDAFLLGYKDPRAEKFFVKSNIENAGRTVVGIRFGAKPVDDAKAKDLYSRFNVAQTDRLLWLPAAEMAFARAEAKLLGWNVGTFSAKEYYEEGIRLSFEQWGAGDADAYLNDEASTQADYTDPANSAPAISAVSKITIKWQEGDSDELKRERIATQKWLALFPLGMEGWSEVRRTGYPKLFKSATTQLYNLVTPNRLPFPPTERKNNLTHYNDAVSKLNGADNFETKLWWNKK